jgi:1-pyrroline-5-carboxylate dehydrogenase
VAKFYSATPELILKAIEVSQQAKVEWDRVPVNEKIKLFLRVADEMATVHRADLNATTMLGQAKTVIQVYRNAVFQIRIRIGSSFDGRLDLDPGGLKRAKKKKKKRSKNTDN